MKVKLALALRIRNAKGLPTFGQRRRLAQNEVRAMRGRPQGVQSNTGLDLTGRSWGVRMDHRLHKLGQYVRGWTAYFGISQYYRPVRELDDWIRRRIRMLLLEAVALGAHEGQAFAGSGPRTAAPSPPARTWTVRGGGALRRRGLQG
jgi:hypothetical protein